MASFGIEHEVSERHDAWGCDDPRGAFGAQTTIDVLVDGVLEGQAGPPGVGLLRGSAGEARHATAAHEPIAEPEEGGVELVSRKQIEQGSGVVDARGTGVEVYGLVGEHRSSVPGNGDADGGCIRPRYELRFT